MDEASACIDGFPRNGLSTDHLEMNKFDGCENKNFNSIFHAVRRMTKNAEALVERRRNGKWFLMY